MKKKNGFTLVELLAVIVILGFISAIGFTSYYRYLSHSQDKTFKMEEGNFSDAVKDAFVDCMKNTKNDFCKNHGNFIGSSRDSVTIYLGELIDDGYSTKVKNPYNTNEQCDRESYVVVHNNTEEGQINMNLEYDVCLICGDKRSDTCK